MMDQVDSILCKNWDPLMSFELCEQFPFSELIIVCSALNSLLLFFQPN